MKRLALLFCLLCLETASAAALFSAAALKKYATDDPKAIFVDPKISCHLTVLLGAKELAGLKENMQSQEMATLPAADGAYFFPGSVRGLGNDVAGIVGVHPDGRLWVGHFQNKRIDYFTNDKASYRKPPKAILDWAEFNATWKYRSAATDNFADKMGKTCSEEKLAAAIKSFEARNKGELCDTGRTFSEPALVTAKAGEKVSFRQGKAYLVDGDLVQLSSPNDPKQPYVCALYRADSQSKKAGELARNNLVALDEKVLASRAKISSAELPAWVGTWDAADAQLVIKLEGPQLTVSGAATAGANVGEVTGQLFDVTGATAVPAKTQPKDALACDGLKLYRFNNALYVSENGQCGGVGVTFDGTYIKARPAPKKSGPPAK